MLQILIEQISISIQALVIVQKKITTSKVQIDEGLFSKTFLKHIA